MKRLLIIPFLFLCSCQRPTLTEENKIIVYKIKSIGKNLKVYLSSENPNVGCDTINLPLSATVHVGDRVFWCEEEKVIKFLPPITEKE